MSVLRFQIRQPSGQIDQIFIESERVLIGSGAHCEIRLPLDQAAVEHCLVQVGPAGVFVQALAFQPPPTVNGIPFTQGPLPADAVLGVGQFQINVTRAEGVTNVGGIPGQATAKKKKGTGPIAIVAILALLGGGYMFFFMDEAADTDNAQHKPPELWGAPLVQCTQPQRDRAAAFALERYGVANSLRERRPFHVQDGIAAVPIYEISAACYKVAGDDASAAEALQAAKTLRQDITDDYRTHRVRLEHALQVEDLQTARKEVKTLLQFTEGKPGEYVTWLSNLDRSLKLKLGRPAS
ncbi:hypothetical protein LZC95_07135 [Pendulispora brunnea]|uniref:FHA domain-containing protein n=1 Tax=Pendulispora brunnea TaxID=2905690 RepID=A0ABZ2KGE3_9BACT